METLKYIIEQIQSSGGKLLFIVFSMMGMAGVAVSIGEEEKQKYTKGQKFLMFFTGGSFALFTGIALRDANVAHAFVGLASYFVGLYSNGFVKHSLDNQKALFNKIFTAIYTILDVFINKFTKTPIEKDENPQD